MFNEIGINLGVDYLCVIEATEEVHAKGGKVKKLILYRSGLPRPQGLVILARQPSPSSSPGRSCSFPA